jgi:hypothetical protein
MNSETKVHRGCRAVPGYCGSSLSRDVYLDSVIGDLYLTLAGECGLCEE